MTAIFSPCDHYRYRLTREPGLGLWNSPHPKRACFVMLNPSTADAEKDDPTIRRCIGFARSLGCGVLDVVNLYALRATDPWWLTQHANPIGPENDAHIARAIEETRNSGGYVIAAWGATRAPGIEARVEAVRSICRSLGVDALYCVGKARDGHPRHPLYLPASSALAIWNPPEAA